MLIRKARTDDAQSIETIYDHIHAAASQGLAPTGWLKGVYPARSTILEALARDDLFVLIADDRIAGSGIINHIQLEIYGQAPWRYPASANEVMVLHTLAIEPASKGKGLGRAFVDYYEEYARKNGARYLRMDTNAINLPAREFYKKMGFNEIGMAKCAFNGIGGVTLVMLEKKL